MNNISVPTFMNSVLFVKDINASKQFYMKLLGQKIELDSGRYVGFENGLGIWEGEYALDVIYSGKKKLKNYGRKNCEIYFETTELDVLCENFLKSQVTFIHIIKEHLWGQRSFRIYDPDGHILEFGEPLSMTIKRYLQQGWTIEQISDKTTLPVVAVNEMLK